MRYYTDQMAAEILEIPMETIVLVAGDTDTSPYDPGSYASSTTYVAGTAVVKAATEMKRKILEQGAKFLGVLLQDVEMEVWSSERSVEIKR